MRVSILLCFSHYLLNNRCILHMDDHCSNFYHYFTSKNIMFYFTWVRPKYYLLLILVPLQCCFKLATFYQQQITHDNNNDKVTSAADLASCEKIAAWCEICDNCPCTLCLPSQGRPIPAPHDIGSQQRDPNFERQNSGPHAQNNKTTDQHRVPHNKTWPTQGATQQNNSSWT